MVLAEILSYSLPNNHEQRWLWTRYDQMSRIRFVFWHGYSRFPCQSRTFPVVDKHRLEFNGKVDILGYQIV